MDLAAAQKLNAHREYKGGTYGCIQGTNAVHDGISICDLSQYPVVCLWKDLMLLPLSPPRKDKIFDGWGQPLGPLSTTCLHVRIHEILSNCTSLCQTPAKNSMQSDASAAQVVNRWNVLC